MINWLKEKGPKATYGDPLSPMVPKDVLLGFLNQEQARRRSIEEKAKTNVLAITIAFSAMIAGVAIASEIAGIANRSAGWMVWPIIASQSVGIVFLLTGGVVALNALRVTDTYMWTLRLESQNMTTEEINARVSWALEVSQYITSIKSNQVNTSYACIRNGVIALALAALFVVLIFVVPTAFGGTAGCCGDAQDSLFK